MSKTSPVLAASLREFLSLSRILTGVEDLDADLGRQYLDRLASTPFQPFVHEVLDRFRKFKPEHSIVDRVKQEILADDALRPALCQIVLLWFTSAMWDNAAFPPALRYGTPEEYFSGLAWTLVGAHPPGLSGGYFGHWRYSPENEPKELR